MVEYSLENLESLITRNIGKILSKVDYNKDTYQIVYRQSTSFSSNDLAYFAKYLHNTPQDWLKEWRVEPHGTRDLRVILFINKKAK